MGITWCSSSSLKQQSNIINNHLFYLEQSTLPTPIEPLLPPSTLSSPTDTHSSTIFTLTTYTSNTSITKTEINLRILSSLSGISQLTHKNNLYLCGSPLSSSTGASLLTIDSSKSLTNPQLHFLINSKLPHYKPSLIMLPNDNNFIVIGGKEQKECECFDFRTSKWRFLPDLPQERYKASLAVCGNGKYLFVFGGYCSESGNIISNEILSLRISTLMIWEKIVVKEHDALFLGRNCCGCVSYCNDTTKQNLIYIFGGKDNNKSKSNQIIEYNVNDNKTRILKKKLKENTSFYNYQCICDHSEQIVYFLDKNKKLFKLNMKHFINKDNANMINEIEEDNNTHKPDID